MRTEPAIFLDLFGTLVVDHDRHEEVDKITFKPNVYVAVHALQQAGYLVFISVCHAGSPLPDSVYVTQLKERVLEELRTHKCNTGRIVFLSDSGPASPSVQEGDRVLTVPGMKILAEHYELDLTRCVIIGDLMMDVYLGKELGMTTVLLSSTDDAPGYEQLEWIEPDYLVEGLTDVVTPLVCALSPKK